MTDNYVSKGLRGEAFKREHPINQDDWAPILEEVLGLIQTLDEKMKLLRVAASFDRRGLLPSTFRVATRLITRNSQWHDSTSPTCGVVLVSPNDRVPFP